MVENATRRILDPFIPPLIFFSYLYFNFLFPLLLIFVPQFLWLDDKGSNSIFNRAYQLINYLLSLWCMLPLFVILPHLDVLPKSRLQIIPKRSYFSIKLSSVFWTRVVNNLFKFWYFLIASVHVLGAPNENIVQNHLNIALLNVF